MTSSPVPAELLAFALVALRVVPSGLLFALLSRAWLPSWIGLGWSLAVAAGLSPGVQVEAARLAEPAWLLSSVARELCIGLAFALAAAVPLLGLSFAVRSAERPAPFARAPFEQVYVLLALVLLLSLGGHRAYVGALSGSLSDVPVGVGALRGPAFFAAVVGIVGDAFGVALALGLPLWMALWLIDLTLVLVDRARSGARDIPRAPERATLALLCLALLLSPLVSRVPALFRASLAEARALVVRVGR